MAWGADIVRPRGPGCSPRMALAEAGAAWDLPSRLAPWRRSGSNRRPPACKAGALPAELRPRDLMQGSGQSPAPSPGSVSRPVRLPDMGQGGLEPPTPRLSSVCSNQLSYWPKPLPNPCQTFWRAASASLPGPGGPQGLPGLEGCAAGALASPGLAATGAARGGIGRPGVCEREYPARVRHYCQDHSQQASSLRRIPRASSLKGGDPAAGSPTATLLRLHPSR